MRENRIFSFDKVPKDAWKDLLERGGLYAVLPTKTDLSEFEIHSLRGEAMAILSAAPGILDSNDVVKQRALRELCDGLLTADIAVLEAGARNRRSAPALRAAIEKRRAFRDWQFDNGEVRYFGPPGELVKLLRDGVKDARDDAEASDNADAQEAA